MAGELKHGPLALVDGSMPVLMIIVRDPVYTKCINALKQVQAREGQPILICEENDQETISHASSSLEVPKTVDCLQVRGFSSLSIFCETLKLNRNSNHFSFLFFHVAGCSYSHSNAAIVLPHCCFAWMQR